MQKLSRNFQGGGVGGGGLNFKPPLKQSQGNQSQNRRKTKRQGQHRQRERAENRIQPIATDRVLRRSTPYQNRRRHHQNDAEDTTRAGTPNLNQVVDFPLFLTCCLAH